MKSSVQANHSGHIIYVDLLPNQIKENSKTIYITCGMDIFMTGTGGTPATCTLSLQFPFGLHSGFFPSEFLFPMTVSLAPNQLYLNVRVAEESK